MRVLQCRDHASLADPHRHFISLKSSLVHHGRLIKNTATEANTHAALPPMSFHESSIHIRFGTSAVAP
jgi:hypothetical protein